MAVQMYLVQPKDHEDDSARETIAAYIAQVKGFILMATSFGSLITAFDEQYLDRIKAHHLVEFVGGVNLDPNAPGAAALQQMFAENIAAQLVERGMIGPNGPQSALPPGYRPLRWPTRVEEGGD